MSSSEESCSNNDVSKTRDVVILNQIFFLERYLDGPFNPEVSLELDRLQQELEELHDKVCHEID